MTTLLLVCLMTCQHISAQVVITEDNPLSTPNDSVLLDVKVTNFLFKKIDTNNSIVEFTNEDLISLNNYFTQKEGVVSLKSRLIDKSFEVVSLLQKEGKIVFQHRQVIDILQRMGYIAIQMNCKIEKQYFPLHPFFSKELLPKA